MREFIALARREPGRLNYGSAGSGSVNHLALELMNARAGIAVVHVPYRGIADATKDLLGGQIQAMTASIPATLPQLAEKKLKVLAVTGPRRVPQLPDVPSWQDEGVPDAEVINYWGIVAPAGTPRSVVLRLNAETQKVLARPEVRERAEPVIELALVRIGGYVAGNAITSGICALAVTIGLIVLRVPFAIPLGIWAGFADLIPMVGSYAGAIPAIVIAFFVSPPRVSLR